jgi:hypothetical protein
MRKPTRSVELDDIISNQILGDDPEVIALVMRIHLALEAILIELIATFRNDEDIYRLSFPAKCQALFERNIIAEHQRQAYNRLNDFRNDFAHIFGHRVSLGEALRLAQDLEKSGIDFSDSVGRYTEAKAIEFYGGMLGVLEEIGWCILYDAAFVLMDRGGRDIFADA